MRNHAWRSAVIVGLVLGLGACDAEPSQVPEPTPAQAPEGPVESLDVSQVRADVEFLAADAQEGRAAGGAADGRVQDYIVGQMQDIGLEPAGEDGYRQRFDFTDGVRLRDGRASQLLDRRSKVRHELLPFGHDTSDGPVSGKVIFVGHGIAGDEPASGDYADIAEKVKGKIVVALDGGPSDDPHIPPAKLRPQSKLIAARDRGAVGFVLWDPSRSDPRPNQGKYSDLQIPAVFVGSEGNETLRQWLGAKGEGPPKIGASSGRKMHIDTPVEPVTRQTANLLGRLPGGGPGERRTIYIGAHMDHLGMGGTSSLAPGETAVHNGADDNASGVAAILAMARVLASRPAAERKHDLVFVAFGAEEKGVLGSKHLVDNIDAGARSRILAMLNFDMVGRLSEKLVVDGFGSANEWKPMLDELRGDLVLGGTQDGWGPSDHNAFYAAEIPVLHFFTGAHDDYHRPSDDVEKINWDGIVDVAEFAIRIVDRLDERSEPLTYVAVAKPKKGSGGFRVSLGTMPDYAANVDGLALAGVRAGGPAAKAGLVKGDVITRIGDREIHNIDDYMASFGLMKAGEAIEFEIVRDGAKQTVTVTPGAARAVR